MSCNCKVYQKRLEKLQKKYAMLKKSHKKLLGVTVLLTEALEEFVKGEVKTGINDTLSTCSSIYPDLFNGDSLENQKGSSKTQLDEHSIQLQINENGKMLETATESEREYYEGFMARPRIPRTPQV